LGFLAHTWDYSYNKPHDSSIFSKIESYAQLASERGIQLALENGPIEILEEVMNFVVSKKLEKTIGICIDTGHASMHFKQDQDYVLKHLRTFKEHLLQLHIHDNDGSVDDHHIPGTGCVPWHEVMQILGEKRDSLNFVCELKTEGAPIVAAKEAIKFISNL